MTQFGILPVHTRFREKHISLVKGDLFDQKVDQFVFSSFNGGYVPTETSIWGAARKRFFGDDASYEIPDLWGWPTQVGDTSVVIFETEEHFCQNFPLISLNMIGADIKAHNDGNYDFEYTLRKSLFQLLFACRELSSSGKLGRVLGMPLLGTGDQNLPISILAGLLKQFSEDALSTIECLEDIVICAYSEKDANKLRDEFKILSNQSPLLELSKLPKWQQNSITNILIDIGNSKHILPPEIRGFLDDVLARFSNDPLDKEGIAISSRSFLMKALNASKNEKKLMNKIDQLQAIGTPNVWVSHMHMIRIIGNTAGHPNNAVRRVSPDDLLSILMGLKEFVLAWPRIEAMIN